MNQIKERLPLVMPVLAIAFAAGLIIANQFQSGPHAGFGPTDHMDDSMEDHMEEDGHGHDDTHYHAGFQVFVDGALQDYSAMKYMHISPCSAEPHEDEHDLSDVRERVHLHDGFGDVAHVHDEGVIWRDLFESVGIESAIREPMHGYVDGEPADGLLNSVIEPDETVVFAFGQDIDAQQRSIDLHDRIHKAEQIIESCGS